MQDDQTYFRHLAEAEVERARHATVPSVVRVHYEFAEAYWDNLALPARQTRTPQ